MDQIIRPDLYYSMKQAAYLVGFSYSALNKRVVSGGTSCPPYVKRGTKYLFPKQEFDEWAKQKEIP